MKIISCYGFVNDKKSTIIFSCRRKLVDYYLSNVFVIIEKNSSSLKYVPLRAKQIINAENLHKNYFAMLCYREFPYADNKLKIITICYVLYK